MGFGYHTEHHIFPRMSMKHAKTVSKKLQELYPDRYKIMPKWKAVKMLYQTPRVYKNRTTLINPLTGREVPAMDKPIS
jgi:fatty acid desaturase